MKKPPPELLEFLQRHEPAIRSLTLELRQVVLTELTPCHEYIFPMGRRIVLCYGSSERVIKDNICSIAVYPKKVNLGFHFGSELSDRARLLEGNGKTWRHIGFRSVTELERPKVRPYLREALRISGAVRPRRGTARGVITKVKQQSTGQPSTALPRLF
jgi:hypothetical protein